MILERLSLLNYKNITSCELHFSSKMNCFFGNNGMGKTNLLDAIYFLSFCKSHLNTPDSMVIRNGAEQCMLKAMYEYDGAKEELLCAFGEGKRKVLKRNQKEYERLSDHIGRYPVVMISPADQVLIRGGSDERRKFIDQMISQHDAEYLHALIRYNRALWQRNSLLKKQQSDKSLYEALELQMNEYAGFIYERRKMLLEQFLPFFESFYAEVSSSSEKVSLHYESQLEQGSLLDLFDSVREKDLILGYTGVGIHKDDLVMNLNHQLMRKIGSEGQNKTFLIALKLAQYHFLAEKGMSTPILLLDDVFDKLDAERVEAIINLVSSDRFGQFFITDTNRKYLDEILETSGSDFCLFHVEHGEVKALPKN